MSFRCLGFLRHTISMERSLIQALKRTSFRCQCSSAMTSESTYLSGELGHRDAVFFTEQNDTNSHTMQHEGLFFSMQRDEVKRVLPAGLNPALYEQFKTFNECCLMVRRPALQVLHYLNQTDASLPAFRCVLYGPRGSGRSTALCHAILHAVRNNWMVVHVPWPTLWTKHCKEVASSQYNVNRINQPMESVTWLQHFKTQNSHLLQNPELVTQQTYTWSKREQTEAGSHITDIIEHGISRLPHATDCVGALLREIRLLTESGKFRLLVAIDGVNALWEETQIKMEDRSKLPVDRLTLVHNFRKLLTSNWKNGAMVLTVDEKASPWFRQERYHPRYLLQQEGFDDLSPMLTIKCENYSDKETHSCIEYYIDKKWINNIDALTEKGKKELIFLSNKNPYELYKISSTY